MKQLTVILSYSRVRIVFMLVSLAAALGVILVVRSLATDDYFYGWVLPWNLFLAFIPLGLALSIKKSATQLSFYKKGALSAYPLKVKLALTLVAWALFFPNSPYLITDIKHLRKVPGAPLWFDATMLFGYALTGLLAGLISLYWVHHVALNGWSKRRANGLLAAYIPLASWGIYLGRELRWNSWDIVTRPYYLVWDAITRGTSMQALALTAEFSLLIGFSYLVILALINLNQK